jgi:hypothetical protein
MIKSGNRKGATKRKQRHKSKSMNHIYPLKKGIKTINGGGIKENR